jgi:hypothetical protein
MWQRGSFNNMLPRPKGATNLAFERGAGGGSRLPRPFLVIFRDEREQKPLSQASCLQLAEVAPYTSRRNTPHPALRDTFPSKVKALDIVITKDEKNEIYKKKDHNHAVTIFLFV